MESLHQSLLNFFVSFIASRTKESNVNPLLVKRMMRLKPVQKIIIDSMCRIDPILNQEISISTNNKLFQHHKTVPKQPKLLMLAEDVKNMMENYEDIQGKVSSMKDIVNNLDFTIEAYPTGPEGPIVHTSPNETLDFFSIIQKNSLMSNTEIDEISSEIWGKHMEVEKMLQVELEKYKHEMHAMENKYFYRLVSAKSRAGIKITALENQISTINNFFLCQLERVKMEMEDRISMENEKILYEEEFLKHTSDSYIIGDLPNALQRIRNLQTARQIYEKRMLQDEKLIKGLNNKLKMILENFTELQDVHSNILANLSSLNWCMGTVLERSDLSAEVKTKSFKYLAKQKCAKLEEMLKNSGIFEIKSIESISKKFEDFKDGISHITSSIRDDGVKSKINKLILETKKVEVKQMISPKKNNIPNVMRKNNRAKTAKGLGRELLHGENTIEQLKQALMNIDESMKRKNRMIADDLDEITAPYDNVQTIFEETKVSEAEATPKKKVFGSFPSSPRKVPISPNRLNTALSKPEDSQKQEKVFEHKSVQVHTNGVKDRITQTDSEFYSKIHGVFRETGIENEKTSIADKEMEEFVIKGLKTITKNLIENSSQTEKEGDFFEMPSTNNEIIRNLMNKSRPKSRENHVRKKENLAIETTEIPLISSYSPSHIFSLVPEPSTKFSIEHLKDAAEEYKKEFQLQSQIKGLKKLEFTDIQTLWEEVISRRISDGEKDKISIYLRGYLGTTKYEGEKKKVINMIESNKIADISVPIQKLPQPLYRIRNEISLKNWTKLLKKLILKKMAFITVAADDSPREIFYKAAKKITLVKHRLERVKVVPKQEILFKKSEGSLYKSDKWTLNSVTPTLLEVTIVKSRYKSSGRNSVADRAKSTRTFFRNRGVLDEISKLPIV